VRPTPSSRVWRVLPCGIGRLVMLRASRSATTRSLAIAMASITYSSLTPGNRRRTVAASSVNSQTFSLAALLKFDIGVGADGLEVVFCHGCLPWCREATPGQ
jgi:hypothetical protein